MSSMGVTVRMKRDWQYYKAGDVVEVFAPVASRWVFEGIAENVTEAEPPEVAAPVDVEDARHDETGEVEAAVDSSTAIETASVKQQPRKR